MKTFLIGMTRSDLCFITMILIPVREVRLEARESLEASLLYLPVFMLVRAQTRVVLKGRGRQKVIDSKAI